MTFWKWSRIAANNANADPSCPFPEGMAPSAVNDGTRGMMAAAAKYRDDIAGANLTTGTATAYALSSYQGFDTLGHLDSQQIAFVPHLTNTGACTLNVDGLGTAPIHYQPGVDLPSGTLVQGTPYVVTYFFGSNEFILRGLAGNPFGVPIGGMIPFISGGVPNSAFVIPYGQAISRSVYGTLFNMVGTAYGSGDGSTTFNLPDMRGRVFAGLDNLGGTAANILTQVGGFGGKGGSEYARLKQTDLPNVSIAVTSNDARTFAATQTDRGEQLQAIAVAPSGGQAVLGLSAGGTARSIPVSPSGSTIYGNTSSINGGSPQTLVSTLPPMLTGAWLLRIT